MPRKVRQLIADLLREGIVLDRWKGPHRQFKYSELPGVITCQRR